MTEVVDKQSPYPFYLLDKKPDGSIEDMEDRCRKLREENHQLQLRILGVNELARLLQDRNELVVILKEKNKRLEVSVVRLENRCANFERQIKSQKSNSVPSVKVGQSPFIPGPSRQILEGLMHENAELKKTVNSFQKKGSSGYLEAVKTTQLEEFIEQQKCEIGQLRNQIDKLANMGDDESSIGVGGGPVSLQASVTKTGPLRKQLVKMQQTMMVKDRFCTLLSQQVTELQRKLNSLQSGVDNKVDLRAGGDDKTLVSDSQPPAESKEEGRPSTTKQNEDITYYKNTLQEKDRELEASQKDKLDLLTKVSSLDVQVNKLSGERDVLQQKYVDTSQLYSSLLSDRGAGSNGDGSHQKIEELERMVSDLQKTMDDQVEDYTRELRNKDMSLKAAAIELEEANTSYFTADSKVLKLEKELMLKSHENLEKFNYLESQLHDAEDERDILRNEISEAKEKAINKHFEHAKAKSYTNPDGIFVMRAGGAPSILSTISHGQEAVLKDTAANFRPMLTARGVDTPQSKPPINTATTSSGGGMSGSGMGGRSSMNLGGTPLHPKPPSALPLQPSTHVLSSSSGRPRSPAHGMHPNRGQGGQISHGSHLSSLQTPITPYSTPHFGVLGNRLYGNNTAPIMSQPGGNMMGNTMGMAPTSSYHQLSNSAGQATFSHIQRSNTDFIPGMHSSGGFGGGGGARYNANTPMSLSHNIPSRRMGAGGLNTPVFGYSSSVPNYSTSNTRPGEFSYSGPRGGQGGQLQGASGGFVSPDIREHISGQLPGSGIGYASPDMRDHISGSTSPHHHDSQSTHPCQYGGHPPPHNNNNYQ